MAWRDVAIGGVGGTVREGLHHLVFPTNLTHLALGPRPRHGTRVVGADLERLEGGVESLPAPDHLT